MISGNMSGNISNNAINDYENAKEKTLFRKTIRDIKTDYEFNNNCNNPFVKINQRLDLPSFARYSLFFKKIDNNRCKELVSGLIFNLNKGKNGNIFYNEESGLYFDLNRYFEPAVGHEKIIKTIEYKLFVCNYFNYFINLKNEDDKVRNNGISLMLRNNIKYTDEEK